jgi:CheY-like chemotaxis protein
MQATKTVLIVEDSQVQGHALKLFLEDRGFRVLWARNGREGVTQAQINLPDAIVMDIEMPEMNGFEACAALKENFTTQDIPVILLTARDDMSYLDRGLMLGAVDFIPKDVMSWPVLLDTLGNIEAPRVLDSDDVYAG